MFFTLVACLFAANIAVTHGQETVTPPMGPDGRTGPVTPFDPVAVKPLPALPSVQAATFTPMSVAKSAPLSVGTAQGPPNAPAAYSEPTRTLHFKSSIGGLTQPYRLGTDSIGNLYVSDITDNKVFSYDVNGAIRGSYGSGIAGSAAGDIKNPEGSVVVGSTLYVVDYGNNRIDTFDLPSGAADYFGTGVVNNPFGIALGTDGNLYVVDNGNSRIVKFTTAGTVLGAFGSTGSGSGQFQNPSGIAFDSFGFLYVTDSGNDRVQKFDQSGTFIRIWGSTYFNHPDGITVDRANTVYVVDRLNDRVARFDVQGTYLGVYSAPQPASAAYLSGNFITPGDIVALNATNVQPDVWVSDLSTGYVSRFETVIHSNSQQLPAEHRQQWHRGRQWCFQLCIRRCV